MIQFNLLGEIGLRGVDGEQVDQTLRQPKRLALLAYLVSPTPGTWHRRDTLLSLFWPELDTAHARTSLRNALYVLRNSVGESVLRSRGDEEVSVDPELVATDVAALWSALRERRTDEALALYRGELLPGLFPPDSDGFQRWLDGERARVRVELAKSALTLAAARERSGDLAGALTVLRRVLEIHPDDETAVRRLMALHGIRGDRAGALAAFEEFKLRLARDFEATPAPETIALAEQMRAPGAPAVTPTLVAPVVSDVPRDPHPAAAAPSNAAVPPPAAPRRRAPLLMVALAVVAAALVAGWRFTRPAPPASIGKSAPLTFDTGLQIEPAISPNGRLVAFAKGDSRHMRIFVQRLGGGAPSALSGDSNSVEIMPRWSPDNDQLLFLSRNNAYVAPAIGGAPRLVAAGGEDEAIIRSASWSPNGDSIAVVRHDSLLVRPLEGVGWRLVGRGSQLHSCLWSPNGQWIACVSGNTIALVPGTLFGNRAPSGIVLFPASGGAPIALTDTEKESRSPAWSADGRYLWFLSDRDGTAGEAYAMPIGADGRSAGPLQRMGLTAESMSLTAGRIAYSVYVRSANIWSVPIDTGRVVTLANAARVTSGNQIIEIVRASHDGKWLIYDSNLHGNSDIYRIPIGGGAVERLTDDPREEFAADPSPINDEVVFQRWIGKIRRLFIEDVRSGAMREAVAAPGDQAVARWSPDGRSLVFWGHFSEPGQIFVARGDSNGRLSSAPRKLADAQLPIWSPDGRSIVFLTSAGGIAEIAADSGPVRTLYDPGIANTAARATYLGWAGGHSELWFLGNTAAGSAGIWALRTGGAPPRLLVDLRDQSGRVNGPTFTFDKARFYFTLDERQSNVHVAELIAP